MDRYKMKVAAHLFLIRDNKILLLRRFNTGYEDGNYSVIAGHLDGNETIQQGMCREALEEGRLILVPSDIEIVHVMHRKCEDGAEAINYFCTTKNCPTEPVNAEPHKCDDLSWFQLNQLPENIIPYVHTAIQHFQNKQLFSNFGF
jgi:8-oxo-dGTP diphosphatase